MALPAFTFPRTTRAMRGDEGLYRFVHAPSGGGAAPRRTGAEGIMNQEADPALFTYHEDGLVGTFSFQDPRSVGPTEDDLREILDAFFQQGVLVRADVNNRQNTTW